ncbi:MAG TPA: MarR family transcriptional regulator [Kofleriaceae bacterium]
MQDAHISTLHRAFLDIFGVLNRPDVDERVVRESGIGIERALFPLLVGIDLYGPIGVVELADRAGRDYTTVSRQVGKLDELGLVARQPSPDDARVRRATVTKKGKVMVEKVNATRQQRGRAILADWPAADVDALVRLVRRFADDLVADADR